MEPGLSELRLHVGDSPAELADKCFRLPASELAEWVSDARRRTLELVSDLSEEQLTVPMLEILNPFRWELGHIAYFYQVFLLRGLGRKEPGLAHVDRLYDSFKVDHDDRWGLPLPSRQQTLEYLSQVEDLVLSTLTSKPSAQETYLYMLSVLHEDMHGEAIAYMRQTLGQKEPQIAGGTAHSDGVGDGPLPGDVEIPGGTFQLGASRDAAFVFDNEKWAHTHAVEVAPFRIARAPVTSSEFAQFVEDGGYARPEHWSHQGWTWRLKKGQQHPIYWCRNGKGWLRRHFDQMVPLEPHAPVLHVSWYEAEAYCHWAGRRLPTETEWELAASGEPKADGKGLSVSKRKVPWGNEPPSPTRANLDAWHHGAVDVGAYPDGDSAFGCRQMLGNAWEWTASSFFPFPGYVVDYPYREYSAPWFGYRKVLRGGAWATRARLVNNTYRNFFQPYRNDIFAGFRTCAR
ncbi:MAG: ergothioneine biosynthesis protein EgtB [Deltaproteobacteria bacterium]|nr:ergothioneine biosynthesis protein EgtB [Deltaproteobacteria bacterium]